MNINSDSIKEAYEEFFKKCSLIDSIIFYKVYICGFTYKETGKIFDVSVEAIRQKCEKMNKRFINIIERNMR